MGLLQIVNKLGKLIKFRTTRTRSEKTRNNKPSGLCAQWSRTLVINRALVVIWMLFSLIGINTTLYAEGTKTWSPNSTDKSALRTNPGGTYSFAGFNGPANKRLHIHIEDAANEIVYIGLGNQVDSNSGNAVGNAYNFQIKSPGGATVHGPFSASPFNLTNYNSAVAGPDILAAGGYPIADTKWVFDPAATGAGDYYIEFDAYAIQWFDITVATKGANPSAINGRVWSRAWAVRANDGAAGGYFDYPFNGTLIAYDGKYATKIDFNGAGLRPLEGQFTFNTTGTGNTGNKENDRKSVNGSPSGNPEHKIFLNPPDPAVYPLQAEGQLQNLPLKVADPANPEITIEVTQPGKIELLLNLGGGTKNRRLFADVVVGANQVSWDGKNGEGADIQPEDYPIPVNIAYTQGETHFTAYDTEGLDFGFEVFTQASGSTIGPRLQFWDDSNIPDAPGIAGDKVNVDTGATTRQRWNNNNYGDLNTINTWWFAYRDAQSTTVLLPGDYGDAPTSYGGAVHKIVNTPTVYLGVVEPDEESQLPTTLDGTGDDADSTDDEDAFPTGLPDFIINNPSYNLDVPCAGNATVAGWIDLNHNGSFEPNERASNTCATGVAQLTWPVSGLNAGVTYARFRTATNAADVANPTGGASDGEVEDYPILLSRFYACPSLKADLWFANDESGSVDAQEFRNALDFLYQISDGFVFDDATGVKGGITGWGATVNSAEILMPITENFGDAGDSGLISTGVITNGNGTGVRELYTTKYVGGGTRIDYATSYLAGLINANNKGRRDGVKQVAVFLTDASNSQLKSNTSGGNNWINAANNLRNAGPDGTAIVLVIIAEAAAAYQNDPVTKSIIDQVVGGGLLVIVDNYADAADPTKGYIDQVINSVCTVPDPKKLDWGDAPDTYGTDDTANNSGTDKEGANHTIVDGLHLGVLAPDKEGNGQPSVNADLDGVEDDAISQFPELTTSTSTYTIPASDIRVTNTLGVDAKLYGFIDFNKDGDFDDTGESTVATIPDGVQNPATALVFQNFEMSTTEGDTYARFRISTEIGLIATSAAVDGEVEDYKLTIVPSYDYGDAPDNYGAASHVVIAAPEVYLGTASPDDEDNSLNADNGFIDGQGDDNDTSDDEDGANNFNKLTDLDTTYSVNIRVNNSSTDEANVIAWIDFDGDNVFASDEASVVTVVPAGAGNTTISVNWNAVPADIKPNDSFVRFRITSDALTSNDVSGVKPNGEVEDYPIEVEIGGFPVKGRVYIDSDVDGINDNSEAGVSGLPVVLLDTVNNTCVSTKTDADGNYEFFPVIPGDYRLYEASRETVPTPQGCDVARAKDPSGYRSTTANALAQFSVVDAEITGKDFGDVKNPLFTPDHSGTVLPGNVVYYTHKFTPKSTGTVSFTSNNSGGTTTGWSNVIYQDSNCNGTLDGVEANAPAALNLPTTAGQDICLINKVFAPATVNAGETFKNVINANFDFDPNDATLAGSIILKVTDLTKAATNPVQGSSKLELVKKVENITQNTGITETQNQAVPGDVLKYYIHYSNTGTGSITDLIINDSVPGFTTLNGAPTCQAPLPTSLTSCVGNVSGDDIEWTFGAGDALDGGSEGVVSYEVIID